MVIRVHIACDDKTYRDTIAALLDDDENISVVEKSREAEHGVAAIKEVEPDVVVLAVPPNEDVQTHTRRYQTVAGRENAAVVAFCILDRQEAEYKKAGIKKVVRPSDTGATLRHEVVEAYRSVK